MFEAAPAEEARASSGRDEDAQSFSRSPFDARAPLSVASNEESP